MKNGFIVFLFFTFTSIGQTVDAVTKSLTQGIADDSLKVVRTYDWVTKNISYEQRFLRNRVEGDTTLYQEAYNVIVRKKAICMGYAKLVKAMCSEVGIASEIVTGLTKDIHNQLDKEEHAWNAVKINGEWYLLDATWGASGYERAQKYFLTPPSVLLTNHYPHDPMWQLMEQPIDFDCFIDENRCHTVKIKPFVYRDTIKTWAQKDSLGRMMDEGQRTLQYFPNDVNAIRSLANGHNEYALEAYNRYFNVRKSIVLSKNKQEGEEKVLKLLDVAEYHLKQSQAYYERLATFARKGEFTDAHFNRDMMAENLLKLKEERQFLLNIFKK